MAKPNVVNKQQLLQAAKELIAEQGMEKLTLKAVAERAHVTQGTVYYHFKTKEQLLLEVTESFCKSSWEQMDKEFHIEKALQSAKSRCTKDSMYHHLFFQLVASGLNNESIREKIGDLLNYENKKLQKVWEESPVEGISPETWAIMCNALIDGLALQALCNPLFSTEEAYDGLRVLVQKLVFLQEGEQKDEQ
ncbi:TetR/AcrR family transcriptional regulator [Bacillus sp. JJ1127]|uniref:TetR/AcrR family transcriptional regulator n=1 Tax=Bacillus sp. JJ1127 TaxID=3122952 RepID=UPI002FFE27B8